MRMLLMRIIPSNCCFVQVSAMPRLLATSGQGYGYAVAWSLARLLQPALLQHLSHATQAVSQGGRPALLAHQQQHWRRLLVRVTDVEGLVTTLAQLGPPELAATLQKSVHQDPAALLAAVLTLSLSDTQQHQTGCSIGCVAQQPHLRAQEARDVAILNP